MTILPLPAKFAKVETVWEYFNIFGWKKKRKITVLQDLSSDTSSYLRMEYREAVKKTFDKGFEKLSKSGIQLTSI